MEGAERVREVLERSVKAVTLRPAVGRGTAVTKVRLGPGLACEVVDGPWRLTVGAPETYGGANDAPNPGVYGRTALGSCLAVGYGMWAARLRVPLDALEVEVQADYDARGELGVADDVRPGYTEVRYIVRVESPAPEADVLRVLDTAERYSSYWDDFANPVPLRREVHITATTR
jgi:uncharacterized OsmC-like protein